MDRIDYMNKISEMLDKACDELSAHEFDVLLDRIRETLEDFE